MGCGRMQVNAMIYGVWENAGQCYDIWGVGECRLMFKQRHLKHSVGECPTEVYIYLNLIMLTF